MFRKIALIFATVLVAGLVACGGSDDDSVGTGPVFVELPEGEAQPVMGAPLAEVADPTTVPVGGSAATPTPTPPSKTIDEALTGKLVDELSFEDFPRTSARDLEREFRQTPETANEKIGKSFVVQGDVKEAGADAAGESFVTFKAGLGQVTCVFAEISAAELLRYTPDGTNAVVGTIDTWDAENRVLTLKDCRVVIGY
jgi:hypothetical protein